MLAAASAVHHSVGDHDHHSLYSYFVDDSNGEEVHLKDYEDKEVKGALCFPP